jgi:hypothetical protein
VSKVAARALAPGPPDDAERLWYDLLRWPAFMDGFGAVVRRDEDWPRAGTLIWDSTPHGRGRVLEAVVRHEPGAQVAEIEDERLRGVQTLTFQQRPDGDTLVTLALEYALKERNPFTPLVDVFFIRRAVRDAMHRTLTRFARERRGETTSF